MLKDNSAFTHYQMQSNEKDIRALLKTCSIHQFIYEEGVHDCLNDVYRQSMLNNSGTLKDVYHYAFFGCQVFDKE